MSVFELIIYKRHMQFRGSPFIFFPVFFQLPLAYIWCVVSLCFCDFNIILFLLLPPLVRVLVPVFFFLLGTRGFASYLVHVVCFGLIRCVSRSNTVRHAAHGTARFFTVRCMSRYFGLVYDLVVWSVQRCTIFHLGQMGF